jgi:hypothetical protein
MNEPYSIRFLRTVTKHIAQHALQPAAPTVRNELRFHNVICNSHSWLFHIPRRRIYITSWMNTCVTDRMQNRVFPTGWRLVSSPLWQIAVNRQLQERLSHCRAGTHWIRGRRDSSVGKVTRLRAGRPRTEVRISGRCSGVPGGGVQSPPPKFRSFDKAEPNSQSVENTSVTV